MKKFLLALALVLPMIVCAQIRVKDQMVGNIRLITAEDKSSVVYNRADRLTSPNNYKSIEDGEDFNISPAFDIQIIEHNGEKLQRNVFAFEAYGTLSYTINEGSKLAIKLDNDEIVMLSSVANCRAKNYDMVSGYQYNARPMYAISDEDLSKILSSKVTKIRIAVNGKTYTFEFPNNEYGRFLKVAHEKARNAIKNDQMTDGL